MGNPIARANIWRNLISLPFLVACSGGLDLRLFSGSDRSQSGTPDQTLIIIVVIAALAIAIVALSRRGS